MGIEPPAARPNIHPRFLASEQKGFDSPLWDAVVSI
jgi:hypothetical protein